MSVALNKITKTKCFIYPEFRYPDTLYSKKGQGQGGGDGDGSENYQK